MLRERFKIGAYVSLIIRKNEDVLLIKRFNTNVESGFYGFPGGGVDGNEPITDAVAREALEEVGIKVEKEDLRVVHVLHRLHPEGYETIGFFIETTKWEGELKNMEPNKCDDMSWFSFKALPENLQPHLGHVLDMVNKGVFFSEFGW